MIEAVNRSDLKDPDCKSLPRQRSKPTSNKLLPEALLLPLRETR